MEERPQVILVTGASSGIGFETAKTKADESSISC